MVGGVHGGGHAWWRVYIVGETATAADATHPTGMHSCSRIKPNGYALILRPFFLAQKGKSHVMI